MTGSLIKLGSVWTIGDRIGDPSGFGEVYVATDESGFPCAAKFIPISPRSKRELDFDFLSGSPNVVPVVDKGATATHYVIVMPLAEESLFGHLVKHGPRLDVRPAVRILTDVARGLASLEPSVVHRDLKPANILLLDGNWSIGDFGIARLADAETGTFTQKHLMSAAYAAPEQWRMEHTTNRTDVYSLGVIAYEVLGGQRPFIGPSWEEFREQHLNMTPPRLDTRYPALDAIVHDCLRKSPGSRPTPSNLLERLDSCLDDAPQALEALRAVNELVSRRKAASEAAESVRQSASELRADLLREAREGLSSLEKRLSSIVQGVASNAVVRDLAGRLSISLGRGLLELHAAEMTPAKVLHSPGFLAPFEVIAHSSISIQQPPGLGGVSGRSHSLWYCDAHEDGVFRWFELSFVGNPNDGGIRPGTWPFATHPNDPKVKACFYPGNGPLQLAWCPFPVDQMDERAFMERWINWLAQAAEAQYLPPVSAFDEPENRRGQFRSPRPRS